MNEKNKVEKVGLKKPYLSLVEFMIKAVMKPIPAIVILVFFGALTFCVLGAFGGL